MTHEEICTYEVAKLAKEKGFPQDVDRWLGDLHSATNSNYYNHKGELNGDCIEIIKRKIQKEEIPKELELVAAPTQGLLQRWLREEKRVVFGISPMQEMDCEYLGWCATIYKVDENGYGLSWQEELYYDTYELALENALKYALENLI